MASSFSVNSSSYGGAKIFDVFLSFRGEDTRKTFVSHLFNSLTHYGIYTYKDDKNLGRGRPISDALMEAIEQSKFSIVVLSENYASSRWCLDELVMIMACMETMGQTVVPIFYNVDPAHVRRQSGSFAEAFAKHEMIVSVEKVQGWRDALTKVGKISGWDSRNCDEAVLIEEITKDILDKKVSMSPINTGDLVGVEIPAKEMLLRLSKWSDGVHMIGIWGMGGIGKTALARATYNHLYNDFEGACFLENIKDHFKNDKKALLSEILMEDNLGARTLSKGSSLIKERLKFRKVLIVLDDVDEKEQLEFLANEDNWFGIGSKIIITTRDKRLLVAHGVKEIYEVQILPDDQSLLLFYKYAFKDRVPSDGFLKLATSFVCYAQGLPLALKVLGIHLCGKSEFVWEKELSKLAKIQHERIFAVLILSFNGLDDTVQNIFLDIACFFKGMDKDFVASILKCCGFHPDCGFPDLEERALITISKNKLWMHDLLQDMGREIVRKQSISEPGKCSRLWNSDDICHVLTKNTGTEAVEGMFLNLSDRREMHLSTTAFARMCNLRLFSFYDPELDERHDCLYLFNTPYHQKFEIHLPEEGFIFVSHGLKYLRWDNYPLKVLPSNFCPEYLVELLLYRSNLEQLWTRVENLSNLRCLDLSWSMNLMRIPDLSKAQYLTKLFLDGCTSLIELPSSIQCLDNLHLLSLRDCKELKHLPSLIRLRSLAKLDLSGCSNLMNPLEIAENLGVIILDGCTNLVEISSPVGYLIKLNCLNLTNCTNLKTLPSRLFFLSDGYLNLSGCSNLEKLPDLCGDPCSLVLDGCTSVVKLLVSVGELNNLRSLSLKNCKNLRSLPEGLDLTSLEALDLSGCSKLEKFPEIVEHMGSLKVFSVERTAIEEFPKNLRNLHSLQYLNAGDCTVVEIPDSGFSNVLDIFNQREISWEDVLVIFIDTIFGSNMVNLYYHSILGQNAHSNIAKTLQNRLAVALHWDDQPPSPFSIESSTLPVYPAFGFRAWDFWEVLFGA